jgi:hypothetical protein
MLGKNYRPIEPVSTPLRIIPDSTLLFLLCSSVGMSDRPTSWRLPTPKLSAAAAVDRNAPPARALGPADDLPPDYWAALLTDPRADTGLAAPSVRTLRLSEIVKHLLRVSCSRCG